jgi:hypothetical protein
MGSLLENLLSFTLDATSKISSIHDRQGFAHIVIGDHDGEPQSRRSMIIAARRRQHGIDAINGSSSINSFGFVKRCNGQAPFLAAVGQRVFF